MTSPTTDTLTDADIAAMTRAIATARRESPARSRQIDAKLRDEPWARVGKFCSFSCQMNSLRLDPFEWPPVWIRGDIDAALHAPDDARHIRDAARLLKRMLAAGLSRYEPDPLGALARVEAGQRRAAT